MTNEFWEVVSRAAPKGTVRGKLSVGNIILEVRLPNVSFALTLKMVSPDSSPNLV